MALDDHAKIAKGLDGLRQDLQKQPRKSVRPTCPLGQVLGWLRDFDGARSLLEVPGGVVAGFEPSLDVLPSKQVPKKLSVHATDARRLNFLVKGGEDLRNDARVERLFEAISVTLKTKGCRGIGTHCGRTPSRRCRLASVWWNGCPRRHPSSLYYSENLEWATARRARLCGSGRSAHADSQFLEMRTRLARPSRRRDSGPSRKKHPRPCSRRARCSTRRRAA